MSKTQSAPRSPVECQTSQNRLRRPGRRLSDHSASSLLVVTQGSLAEPLTMRALIQALRMRSNSTLSRGGAAPWGLAVPGRGAAELAAAAAAPAAAGQLSLREFLVYRWDTDKYQSYTVDVDRCGRGGSLQVVPRIRQPCVGSPISLASLPVALPPPRAAAAPCSWMCC